MLNLFSSLELAGVVLSPLCSIAVGVPGRLHCNSHFSLDKKHSSNLLSLAFWHKGPHETKM
jgi:hypothetical protein